MGNERRVVVISGDTGTGKSALLEAASASEEVLPANERLLLLPAVSVIVVLAVQEPLSFAHLTSVVTCSDAISAFPCERKAAVALITNWPPGRRAVTVPMTDAYQAAPGASTPS